MKEQRVFVTDIQRTPLGAPMKSLERFMSSDLAAKVIGRILEKNDLDPLKVDQVVFGQSLPSTMPNNIGHFAWLKAELPVEVPGYTVQANGGSGLQALRNAYYLVATGNDGLVMAGGADSYSAAPFVLRDARLHFYPQDRILIDSLDEAECCTQPEPLSRLDAYKAMFGDEMTEEMAAFAEASRRKADGFAAAAGNEIVSMSYVDRKKGEIVISADEWLGKNEEGLLAPMADCAAVSLLASEDVLTAEKLTAKAEILGFAAWGAEPAKPVTSVAGAAQKLLARKRLSLSDIAKFEIVENSAAEVLNLAAELAIPAEKINPFGGALAFGKCDGAEGILMLQRLLAGLSAGEYGLALSYSAGGMSMAMLVKKL